MRSLCLFVMIMVLISCDKKSIINTDNSTEISDVPKIEFLSISPQSVIEFKESISISIIYEDGNGDIGFDSADSLSLFVKDNRGDIEHSFHIPPVVPNNLELSIRGTLNVNIDKVIILDDNAESEEVIFSVKLKDRSGQWSNEIECPGVTVVR